MFFHGSNNSIDNFTDEFVGAEEATDKEGPGIYFTSSWDDARGYGEYVHTVILRPKKTVSTEEGKNAPEKELLWLMKQAPNWRTHAENFNENPSIGLKIALKSILEYNESPHMQFLSVWIDFYRYDPIDYVKNMVKLGYDAIYVKKDAKTDSGGDIVHAIVLNPNIIEVKEREHDTSLDEIKRTIRKKLAMIMEQDEPVALMYYRSFPHSVYNKELDEQNEVKESNDLEFYNKKENGVDISGYVDTKNNTATLGHINISPENRKKGQGKSEVKKFEQWAKDNGATKINLSAYKTSVGFWDKMGYGLEKDFPIISGHKQDYKSGSKEIN